MASSVSLISASEKKSKKGTSEAQPVTLHTKLNEKLKLESKPVAEDISQDDTSDGQGRESAVLISHSPDQLSSPQMPLSPMAGSSALSKPQAELHSDSALAVSCNPAQVSQGALGFYGLVNSASKDMHDES